MSILGVSLSVVKRSQCGHLITPHCVHNVHHGTLWHREEKPKHHLISTERYTINSQFSIISSFFMIWNTRSPEGDYSPHMMIQVHMFNGAWLQVRKLSQSSKIQVIKLKGVSLLSKRIKRHHTSCHIHIKNPDAENCFPFLWGSGKCADLPFPACTWQSLYWQWWYSPACIRLETVGGPGFHTLPQCRGRTGQHWFHCKQNCSSSANIISTNIPLHSI